MKYAFRKGLHELSRGAWAWIEPDGVAGTSNAGLVTDGDASLLVDTLFDLAHTGEMLKAMRDVDPKAATRIDTLVNSHSDGDHCWGNELVEGAEIIASVAAAEDMSRAVTPAEMAALLEEQADASPTMRYYRYMCGSYEFDGIRYTLPTRTFSGELTLQVGDKRVELTQVGPAHTRGDVLVYVPQDGTVFTGDVLFAGVTPVLWTGPVQGWIDACLRIESMDVASVVPGHGPVTDKQGVAEFRGYLEHIRQEARLRYDAGMDALRAASDIPLGKYASWLDPERIVVNVDRLFREFSYAMTEPTPEEWDRIYGEMAKRAGV